MLLARMKTMEMLSKFQPINIWGKEAKKALAQTGDSVIRTIFY